jgi:hypothetical protein
MAPCCCGLFFPSIVIILEPAPEEMERFLFFVGAWIMVVFGAIFDCITTGEFEFFIEDKVDDPVTIVCTLLVAFNGD